MAYLNGNAVPRLLEGRTLAVKWLGTGLSVASGVTLGLEAPLVHVGACVASLCADAAGRAWEVSYKVAERVGDWRWGKEVTSGSEEREQPLLLQRKGKSSRHRQRRRFIPILQSDAERREFVSAGVAAGLAAAFGAPIGGVLFAMEEASTHWSRKVGWRAFLAATASAVALNQLYPRAFGVLRFAGVAPLSALEWTQQLPLLALVAAVGGLMGAAFQAMHRSAARRARRSRESASDNSGGQKSKKGATTAAFVLRAAVTSAAIVLSMFALSLAAGTCVEVPEWRDKGKERKERKKVFFSFLLLLRLFFFSFPPLSHSIRFPPPKPQKPKHPKQPGYGFVLTCPAGTYNDLATLFFAPAADTASHIFSSGALTPRFNVCSKGGSGAPGTEEDSSCYFTLRSLALLCPSYFVAMAASSATGLPGGLFLPSIVAGGAFGGTAGLLLSRALPAMRLQAGLFAMVGATAALGGVFRASVALVVLVVEGTQSVRFLLAIAVAAIAANWAGDLCRPGGVYESDLEADGRVVFLRPTPPLALRSRTAGTVAARGVWALREVESVAYVLEVLTRTRHNGFPVVAEKRERKGKERKEGGEKESGEGGGVGGASSAAAAAAEEQQQQQQQPASSDPVSSATSREGVLVGLILRSQLLVLLRARCFCDGRGRAIPRAAAEAAVVAAAEASAAQEGGAGAAAAPPAAEENDDDHDHHHSHDVFALDSAMRSFFRLSGAPTRRAASLAPALSAAVSLRRRRSRSTTTTTTSAAAAPPPPPLPSLADCFVDLRPFMDRAPLSVRPECPAERAHAAFVSLGLRHLPLTTAEGRLCGMLTRKDLDAAAGAGPWRRSRIASAPAPPPPGGLHVPSELLPPGGASPGVEGLLGRRARDFAAAVWPGGGNYSSSGSLRNQGGRGGGGGEDRV